VSATGVTLAGRAAAEAIMVDACTVTMPAATASQSEVTGKVTKGSPTSLYSGKCRLQLLDVRPEHADAGERIWTAQQATISVPVSVTGIVVGCEVTITASALDPDLVGKVFRVRAVASKTYLTARRLTCERVTS
jgi:hypothetical protein